MFSLSLSLSVNLPYKLCFYQLQTSAGDQVIISPTLYL